ncbi:induced myeloid leukemia cell differentiation protein Mcl-1b [Syngnathus scovelli]|uniref:induced myeloid leukemia cell differentiation protein Mcl-1b n=1 Tax=Syngnathus scovelli TaxID=161590 RepID=UPI0021109856|nr:induced myeloid leukemia cell differentiation protein Mcl-1b [Syngnathus scovelli]
MDKVPKSLMSYMFPQNGVVVEGSVHCSSPPVATATAATLDPVNGNSAAAKQRPSALEMVSKGTLTSMNLHNHSSDAEGSDGSPPVSPDSQEPPNGNYREDAMDSETKTLICRFLTDFTGLSKAPWNESKAHSTLKRVVASILEKHKYKYNGIVNKLSLDDRGDDVSFVSEVAKSLFSDGTTNWGRVASLVAFGAAVSQYLKEKGQPHCVEAVADEISSYLLSHQRNWLLNNNSWDGFVAFFRETDPESTMWNTLVAFAGVAGIGATLALLIR